MIRIHEIAKEVDMTSKEIREFIYDLFGIDLVSHLCTLEDEEANVIIEAINESTGKE